jgi:hypothetical protein
VCVDVGGDVAVGDPAGGAVVWVAVGWGLIVFVAVGCGRAVFVAFGGGLVAVADGACVEEGGTSVDVEEAEAVSSVAEVPLSPPGTVSVGPLPG